MKLFAKIRNISHFGQILGFILYLCSRFHKYYCANKYLSTE